MASVPLPFSSAPWLWFIGASVGLIVGLIAFLVASRLFNEHEGDRPERQRGTARYQR